MIRLAKPPSPSTIPHDYEANNASPLPDLTERIHGLHHRGTPRALTAVGFIEVREIEVREVLRGWLDGAGLRRVADPAGDDRKPARHYVPVICAADHT